MAQSNKVLITDHAWPDVQVEATLLAAAGLEVVDSPRPDEATLSALAADAVAIMTCFAQVTPRVIESASGLRVVARFGVGVDNIAVDSATARAIPVTYVPDYCVAEVAEHALALMLAQARGVVRYDRSVKARDWDLAVAAPLRRIEGQTLGLIGCGRIGARLAAKALGLGLRVLAYDPGPGRSAERRCPRQLRRGARDLRLRESACAAHARDARPDRRSGAAQDEADRLPGQHRARRPGRHDRARARARAKAGSRGAALDVLPTEPIAADDPLLDQPNVVLTPHVAFYSEESLAELRRRTAQSVIDVLAERAPEHLANAAALAQHATQPLTVALLEADEVVPYLDSVGVLPSTASAQVERLAAASPAPSFA